MVSALQPQKRAFTEEEAFLLVGRCVWVFDVDPARPAGEILAARQIGGCNRWEVGVFWEKRGAVSWHDADSFMAIVDGITTWVNGSAHWRL